MLPLRAFDGWLKQIRAEGLSVRERLALSLTFPALSRSDPAELESAEARFRSETESFSVAGVPTLPADFRTNFVVARTFF
jgi:hypothetical protein